MDPSLTSIALAAFLIESNSVGSMSSEDKAFDSVDHTFLFATLTEVGFGPDFIRWLKTFLKDCQIYVMNSGHASGYFPLNRGSRRGDPLSAYLFILVLQVMLIQIRDYDNIKGINLGDLLMIRIF